MSISNHKIVIDADVQKVSQSFDQLGKMAKDFEKKKFGINFDTRQFKQFEGQARKVYDQLIAHNEKLSKKINLMANAMGKVTDERKLGRAFTIYSKMVKEAEKGAEAASSWANSMHSMGIGGGVSRTKAPSGASGDRNALSGLLGGRLGGLLKGGAIVGIIMAAIKGFFATMGPAREAAPQRVALRGMGMRDWNMFGLEHGGLGYGYGSDESRKQAIQMFRQVGGIRALGATQLLSRGTGLEPDRLIGMMGNLRQAGIQGSAGVRLLKEIFTDAVAAGFDESRAYQVMEAVTQKTAQMAQMGSVNPQAIRTIMSSLMTSSPFFQQNSQRAMRMAESMQTAFTQGGPMQMLAMRSMLGLAQSEGFSPSPSELLFAAKQGPLRGNILGLNGPQMMQGMTMQMIREMTKRQGIQAGAGMQGLTPDQVLKMSTRISDALQLNDPGMARELIVGTLTKGPEERIGFFKRKWEENLELQRTTKEVLMSSDVKLMGIFATLQMIKEDLSSLVAKFGVNLFGRKASPWDALYASFGPAGMFYNQIVNKPKDMSNMVYGNQYSKDMQMLGMGEGSWPNIRGMMSNAMGIGMGTGGGNLSAGKKVKAKEIYNLLRQKGVSDIHAKGMLSNIQAESAFKTGTIGDYGTSGGLFQHHNERFTGLKRYAASKGKPWTDLETQIDYALSEQITQQYLNTSFTGSAQASQWFTTEWERPVNRFVKARQRLKNIQNFQGFQFGDTISPTAPAQQDQGQWWNQTFEGTIKELDSTLKGIKEKQQNKPIIESEVSNMNGYFLNKTQGFL